MQAPDPITPSELASAAVPTANVQVQPAGGAVVLTARGELDATTPSSCGRASSMPSPKPRTGWCWI
ncbi:hypothetical protein [Amycolatopsis sp. NPDC051903]|uniref:hypothetical protein n=1 Tax=Amycolatopsis sp. NPDC051903 TaxID=3363936 RepID=UPI00378A9C75